MTVSAVILAGGLGTRLSEETSLRPKPMIEIGGMPILLHIMKHYSSFGVEKFVICLGYKGYVIKDFFANYFLHTSDVTFNLRNNSTTIHRTKTEPWVVTLVDTGEETMIGGRIKRILPFVRDDPYFHLTYGDGVGTVNIKEVVALHEREGRLATMTATQQPGRFGIIKADGTRVLGFREKPDGGWVNGGFFVLSPKVGEYITDDTTVWEQEPLERLASDGQLSVYYHEGFWQPMDVLRDKQYLEELWKSGNPPWKVW